MIINHNISALNTYRQLTIVNSSTAKSLEKLSSGLRINRAGDDAAGLAISEKMRGQIRGLDQAIRNAQDGISLIQTAEGGLNETHSILQRMRELANQASNDTLTEADRVQIQKEINQLTEEVQRIGVTTEFNTQKLLDSTFTNKKFHIGANGNQTLTVEIGDMRSAQVASTDGAVTVGALKITTNTGVTATVDGVSAIVNEISLVYTKADGTLGTATTNAISVMTQSDAESAISTFQTAIDKVSTERAKLGAYQNRLEHTINNLGTASENLSAAESRIRDVDYAEAA